jgi:transaldolase
MTRLKRLQEFGQSVYMDEIRRSMLTDGTLKRLIERDGLRGVTSNPAIFQKAIAESNEYDDTISQMQREGQSVDEIYEELVIADIEGAADLLRPVYDESDGRYGFVSLEVNPHLAFDTDGTIAEARHLWSELARPNVFIKVPGTEAGLPAIRELTAEGVNVNVTLLFGIGRYRRVAEEYIAGLEQRLAAGQDIHRVASVASFFLSRIDVMVDPMLEAIELEGGERGARAAALKGKIAIANAKLAYRAYQEIFGSERWARLAERGARTQRVLWASTSTKNPAYSDTMYVEPLIGPDTVNTMPVETLDAYRDHGEPAARLEEGMDEAAAQMGELARLGIDIDEVTARLESEGVEKFVKPFDSLMKTLAEAASQVA